MVVRMDLTANELRIELRYNNSEVIFMSAQTHPFPSWLVLLFYYHTIQQPHHIVTIIQLYIDSHIIYILLLNVPRERYFQYQSRPNHNK